MLTLEKLYAGYASSEVLQGIDLQVDAGEVVTLLGRNGMGKTTTLSCISGLLKPRAGTISFDGHCLNALASHRIARFGIGLVPEQRHIFPNLSVVENLMVAAANYAQASSPWQLESIYELFPRLAERAQHLGNQLSGGEQQMLAIGRALMINPRLLLLDEATEGLAPLVREEIWRVIRHLKTQGLSILVVDKNLDTLLDIADRFYLMEKGQVVAEGPSGQLREDHDLQVRYLGV